MMPLKYSGADKNNFSFDYIKNKLSNKIFAIKSYEDGSKYCGFLDENTNEITKHAIFIDLDGRKLMGKIFTIIKLNR